MEAGVKEQGGGREQREALTRERIAAAALEITDRSGLDALSMRLLANRLGVGTMTLYGYFRNKVDLLDAIVDCAVAEAEPFPTEGDWRSQLRETVMVARRNLLSHPSLVELRMRRPVLRPEALRFSEKVMSVFGEAGFDPAEAARAFRLIFTYTLGYAALSPAEVTEESRRDALAVLERLPRDDYPALAGSLQEASDAMGGEEAFEYGLECILDGLATRVGA
jgi:AcrR family transcriptional regulator